MTISQIAPPTDEELREWNHAHSRAEDVNSCLECMAAWPCQTARLLALVESQRKAFDNASRLCGTYITTGKAHPGHTGKMFSDWDAAHAWLMEQGG